MYQNKVQPGTQQQINIEKIIIESMAKKKIKKNNLQILKEGEWKEVTDLYQIVQEKNNVIFIDMDKAEPRGNYRIEGKKVQVQFLKDKKE